MSLRSFVKSWIPPALLELLRRVRSGREPVGWEYRPEGWPAGPDAAYQGWNQESVAATQVRLWPQFQRLVCGTGPLGLNHTDEVLRPNNYGAHNTILSFGYALALAASGKEVVSVLDWGGGIGHYGLLARSLLPGTEVDYTCKDVPVLCAAGRQVLPWGTFVEDEDQALSRQYDLVLVSGSLHYSHDWRTVLRRLAGATGRYLLVTRLPVVRQVPSFVVVQRPHGCGYLTEYPGWFLNYEEVLAAGRDSGLTLVRELLVDEQPPVPGAPEQAVYAGFLFSRTF